MPVSDIVEFIRERLAEDERAAYACGGGESWSATPADAHGMSRVSVDYSVEYVVACTRPMRAEHIAHHNPGRVLREVEAKRRVLARHHEESHVSGPICRGCGFTGDLDEPRNSIHECEELQDLAAAWSDHPSYRPEWSPQ